MTDKKLMYNEQELMLIKTTFAENEDLLKAVRNLFFGVEISPEEKKIIKQTFSNPDVLKAVRHKVYGLNNFNTPIGQLSDFWMGIEQQIFGASRDTITQAIMVKEKCLAWFTTAFKLLENPDGEKVSVEVEVDELGINIIARNLYMRAIDTGLYTILTIAGKKEETIEDLYKRLEKNSNK
jgi:hypothetical protein